MKLPSFIYLFILFLTLNTDLLLSLFLTLLQPLAGSTLSFRISTGHTCLVKSKKHTNKIKLVHKIIKHILTEVRVSCPDSRNASFKSSQGFIIPPFHILQVEMLLIVAFVLTNIYRQYHSVCIL